MKFGAVRVEESAGAVLAHTLAGADGRKLLNKGHLITGDDAALMQSHGITSVIVARLAPDDLGENEAARRVGQAVSGEGVRVVAPGAGRANLMSEADGVLHVDVGALHRLNAIDEGITIATLHEHSLARAAASGAGQDYSVCDCRSIGRKS
jgi:molybdenum cofactor cytidylyltransferase